MSDGNKSNKDNNFEGYIEDQIFSDDECTKYLLKDPQTSKLYFKSIYKNANAAIYKQLLNKKNTNIIKVLHVQENGSEVTVIEEYVKSATLEDVLKDGVPGNVFEDFMLQTCDALLFLQNLKKPISYNNVSPKNLLICNDNLLKITNFQHAEFSSDQSNDIKMVASLIDSVEEDYIKNYVTVIKRCDSSHKKAFQNIQELRTGILKNARTLLGHRYAIGIAIGVSILIVARIIRYLNMVF